MLEEEPRKLRNSLIGKKFGKLLVKERTRKRNDKNKWITFYICQCDCGEKTTVAYFNLVGKRGTKSCGCYRSESCFKRESRKDHYPFGIVFSYYKRNAKDRSLEWKITKEEFTLLLQGDCFYCGRPPEDRILVNKTLRYNGIDRVENNIGYVADNLVSCCSDCNLSKRSRNIEEFLDWVCKVHDRREEIKKCRIFL